MSSSDDNVRETQQAAEVSNGPPTSYSWRAVAVTFAVAAVTLAISTAIVHSGKVSSLEEDVFHAINDLPGFLEPVMYVFQLLGILFVPLIVAIVAALYRKWWLTLCLVLVIPLKLFFEKKVIKEIVDRQRPGTSICHGDLTCGHFRGDVSIRGESFVSGHAMITGAIATLLFFYLGRTGRIVVIGLAVMNGIARVYLGAHNPLDVVGGGALGVCIGCILLLVFDPVRRDARHHARVLAKRAPETA